MPDFHVTSDGKLTGAGLSFSCAIGRGGIAEHKTEGDGVTPAGRWTMIECYYRPDKMGPPKTGLPARPIGRTHGWCDDPNHRRYNQLVQLPFSASHEVMWREDHLYDALVVLDYNIDPAIPHKGSAIFMHFARPAYTPTEGCVALAPMDFMAVVELCDQQSKLIVQKEF